MRLLWIATTLCSSLLFASVTVAQPPQQIDFAGSWTFMWDNNLKNTNVADLKAEAGIISGTYMNDAKDKCLIVGRFTSSTNVALTITCPKWDIKCDGSVKNSQLVVGRYVAYGSTAGGFQMSRK